MSSNTDIIALNDKLLSLYLQVSTDPTPGRAAHVIDQARGLASADAAQQAMLWRYLRLISLHLPAEAAPELMAMASLPPPPPATPEAFAGHGSHLARLSAEGRPGVSVVTCSMNRTENLLMAIPSWLVHPQVSEVVIVDWSSRQSVAEALTEAGLTDPRLRVLRVEGEPRWILSYAFNAGFRAAACDTILKADADIVLAPDFFARNPVGTHNFIAGNWRAAPDGQVHVNGFFYVSRKGLHSVGGFNEFITTYGWDDDDIYTRMTLSGLTRRDVAPGTIHHVEHDDAVRIGGAAPARPRTAGEHLMASTKYLIGRNRYIANVMPVWDAGSVSLPFRITGRQGRVMTIEREGWEPSVVPAHVQAAARLQSLTDLLAWRLGPRVYQLDPPRIERLLERPHLVLSRIDVELALADPGHMRADAGHYLVMNLAPDALNGTRPVQGLSRAFTALIGVAAARGLKPVLRAGFDHLPEQAPACLKEIPIIPAWEPLGDVPQVTVDNFFANVPLSGDMIIEVDDRALNTLGFAVPAYVPRRSKLFIDVQHGLGNRLRALGSAAAIAEASNRELVVVWQPDHHCDCRLSDLFDYSGAVLEERFLDEAPAQHCDIYNYMPGEPDARKDEPLRTESAADIYARSAFVLQSEHSTWESENRFLQSLTPVDAVRSLVASVRHPNALSAHIRMEAGAGRDHNSYDRPENWRPEDHALIHEWRAKSHFSHFLTRIDALIAEGRAESLFVAADLPETYATFADRYGARVAWLPRALYDRSAAQLHYALADAILLSRSPLLLGSTWSSFSELAMRLASEKIAIEMSGKDF